MAEATTLSFRCPDDVHSAIKDAMSSTHQKQSTVIINALRRGLGLATEFTDTRQVLVGDSPALQHLTDRLADLEGTVRQHDHLLDELADLKKRLRALEAAKVAPVSAAPSVTSESALQNNASATQVETEPLQGQDTPDEGAHLTVRQAFVALGGNPDDNESTVPNSKGDKRVKWNTFRLAKQTDYTAFGFVIDQARKDAKDSAYLMKAPTPARIDTPLFTTEELGHVEQ